MRTLMLAALLMASIEASASDIPWFNQGAAEQLVRQAEPAYLAHIQARIQEAHPGKYANKLHKALAIVASRDAHPELYRAWSRACAAEVAYIQAADAYRAALPHQQASLRPGLAPLATEWESAIEALYAIKIPLTEDKLFNLEASLSDHQANFDAFVMDRVLNTTQD